MTDAPLPSSPREYSLVLLKPDAVEQDICVHVLHRIEHEVQEGRIRATRILQLTKELLREHYAHLVKLDCYPRIERFMMKSEVWVAIIEGAEGTIRKIRDILGATDPRKAAPGTIRHQFGRIDGEENYNVAHASDSQETAFNEIRRFFSRAQIVRDIPELADILFGKQEQA